MSGGGTTPARCRYYYQEVVPIDDFYEMEENTFFANNTNNTTSYAPAGGEAPTASALPTNTDGYRWKGFINLKLAKVGLAPADVLDDHRRNNSIMIMTPLRTYVLVAMHELSSEDWMMQIWAAQQGSC